MSRTRQIALGLVAVAIVVGTVADRPRPRPTLTLGGYRVLAADFHTHSSTWSDGALTPWGLVLDARHNGLDVMAITGHNQISDSRMGQWFSQQIGGPVVLTGEEIHSVGHHVIALGISTVVDFRLSVLAQIEEVHRQGGVAIAAHPTADFWPGFAGEAMSALDGAEICHPLVWGNAEGQGELEQFSAHRSFAAIGSSDFHGLGRMGTCRTYVFVEALTPTAVIDAIRLRRTVVYGPGGKAYGDPALVQLAAAHPELREAATIDSAPTWLDRFSLIAGLLGLAGLLRRPPR